METKQCLKCGKTLPVGDFHLHHCTKTGKVSRRNVCKNCENARKRAHYHDEKPVLLKDLVGDGDPAKFQPEIPDLATVYLNLIHWKPTGLRTISLEKYNRHFNLDVTADDFVQIEDQAEQRLQEFGYFNPLTRELPEEGKYLVIGDTFGTHTPECVFQLLQRIVQSDEIEHVIILGHNLDDENLVSNLITSFGVPVTIVAIKDELKDLHAQRGYGYDIVQDSVTIGNIILRNQEHITPYVKTALSSLDPMLFPGRQIVNCTRQELSVRPTPQGFDRHFIASPGCLADPHVVTTINRLIFNDGGHLSVRPTNKDSYLKHRKNEVDKHLWERGFILFSNGNFVQRRIFVKDGLAYAVSRDRVLDSAGNVYEDTQQTMVLSDLHVPNATDEWLAMIFKEYHPDRVIMNGDIFDCRSFNPHSDYEASHANFADDIRQAENALDELFSHSFPPRGLQVPQDRVEFLWGNHEEFIRRFTHQYPQFESYFNQLFIKLMQKYGHVTTQKHTEWFDADGVVIHHGSADIFGTSGNNLEKTARTFQCPAIIGHTHSPAIRFGVYRTGCLCAIDQGYNNANMSNWARGFAMIHRAAGMNFIELRNWI